MEQISDIRKMVKYRVLHHPAHFDINYNLIDKLPDILINELPEAVIYNIENEYSSPYILGLHLRNTLDQMARDEACNFGGQERDGAEFLAIYIVEKISAKFPSDIANHYTCKVVQSVMKYRHPFKLYPFQLQPQLEPIRIRPWVIDGLLESITNRTLDNMRQKRDGEQEDREHENKWLKICAIIIGIFTIAMLTGTGGNKLNWFQILMMVPGIFAFLATPYFLILKLFRYIKKQF